MRRAVLVCLCVAASSSAALASRPGHVALRTYGSDDGLTALDLVAGVQDREGFLWAASPNGLFRYDGTRFRRFSVEDGLPSTLVTDLVVSPDGVLWGATSRGLCYLERDRFVAVGVGVLPLDGMHLIAFADGRTWITTTRGPFAVAGASAVEPVPGWPGGEAFGILVDPGGAVLISRGSRLLRRAHAGARFEDIGHDFVEKITSIVRDGAGRLWLRAGEHLWMQPRAGAPFQDRSRSYLGSPVGSDGLRLAIGATGTLLIPTSIGLIEVDGDDAHFVASDLADDARSVKSVWVDREGALWLTSLGLHHELGRGLWRTISTRDGLPVNNVWSIAGLHDGRVAVGTDAGVAILGGAPPALVATQSVAAMVEQPAGVLWIGTGQKLMRYDVATGQRAEFGAESGLPDRKLSVMAADGGGALWIGFSSGGLFRGQASAEPRFERVTVPEADDSTVSGIAFDDARLWITTSRGLYVRDRGAWHRFTTRDGLRDDGMMFLTARRDHEICATYLAPYGLTCLRYADGAIASLRHIDEAAGLNSPVPYFLAEDSAGRLWVGGAQGVSIFEGATVDQFTRASGAPGDDCNANAVWVAPGGEVWIGTSSGVGVFDGARYRGALPPPEVTLERGHLGDAELGPDTPRSVAHDASRFDAELAALSFVDERHLEIAVKLAGFDDTWHAAESRVVRYQKLPAGTYQFAARARHRNSAWGAPTTYDFVVEPPWWNTLWFYAACTSAGLAAVALFVRWRSQALVRRNLELEHVVRVRTQELVAANARIANSEKLSALGRLLAQLSHEINNPLNVIQNNFGPLEEYARALCAAATELRELATDPDSQARADDIWQRLDLDYIIDDIAQAFAISKTAVQRVSTIHHELKAFLRGVPPERQPTDLAAAVRDTVAMMQRALPGVELRCELDPMPIVRVHASRIQQTLTNLVQNAADSMHRSGRITIQATADDRVVHIRVADTGPGVAPELRSKIFEPFFTTKEIGQGLGLGLSICREIVVAHGGTLELDEHHVGGACFVISLPIP